MMDPEKIVVSAPGKIILFGEHAVVYGKVAVAGSLNMRTRLSMKIGENRELLVDFENIGFVKRWNIEKLETAFNKWPNVDVKEPQNVSNECEDSIEKFIECEKNEDKFAHLAQIVFFTLYLNITRGKYGTYPCLNIKINTDLPVGSGLGSSASMSACLATLFLYHVGILSVNNDSSTYELTPSDLNLINQWTFVAERIVHGKPSGIDNSICTFGGILEFQSGDLRPISSNINLKILLINTKVPRNTKTLVTNVQQLYKTFPKIVLPILDAIGCISETACSVFRQMCDEKPDLQEHYSILEKLISMNHPLLESLGVSHPQLNRIHQRASEVGLQAKLTGAGGGGCAFVLVPPYADPNAVIHLKKELEDLGFQCWETCIGSAGLKVEVECLR